MYGKTIANIVLNGEKLKTILLKSRARYGCLLCPLLFNIVLEALTREIRWEKETKGTQTGREEAKSFVFADAVTLCTRSQNSPEKFYKQPIILAKNRVQNQLAY